MIKYSVSKSLTVDAQSKRPAPSTWQMPYKRSALTQRSATIPVRPGMKSEPTPIVAKMLPTWLPVKPSVTIM